MQTVFEFAAGVLQRRQGLLQDERLLEQILSSRYGLSVSLLAALAAVEQQPRSFGEVGDEMGVTSGAVTRAADRLVELGLATRVIPGDDRRVTLLQITAPGAELLTRIRSDTHVQEG